MPNPPAGKKMEKSTQLLARLSLVREERPPIFTRVLTMFTHISHWFGNKSTKPATRPAPRSVRLGIDNLEKRELMSATPAGYLLNNGNLYNAAISLQQPID